MTIRRAEEHFDGPEDRLIDDETRERGSLYGAIVFSGAILAVEDPRDLYDDCGGES